jgi:chromosome segregation ATPase
MRLSNRCRVAYVEVNDGKVRVTVDLAEIQYKPLSARSPGGHRTEIDRLNARIEQLRAELARLEVEKRCLEACAAGHRADFEHERKRLNTLMTETRTLAHFAMSAREKAARLEGELSAVWAHRRWWRRLLSPTSRPAVRLASSSRSPVLVGVPVRI